MSLKKMSGYDQGNMVEVMGSEPDFFYPHGRPMNQKPVSIVLDFAMWDEEIEDWIEKVKIDEGRNKIMRKIWPDFATFCDTEERSRPESPIFRE